MTDEETGFEQENNKKLSETHYPYFKELEPAFWKRQEEILRELEQIKIAQAKKEKKVTSWNDYPPLITESNPLIEEYSEIVADYLLSNKYTQESATNIGDVWVEPKANTIVSTSTPSEEVLKTEETLLRITDAYAIWTIIQPTHLYPMPNGKWDTDRWVPQIYLNGLWQAPSNMELYCRNWNKIPNDKKRVQFCIGILPSESSKFYTIDGEEYSPEEGWAWGKE